MEKKRIKIVDCYDLPENPDLSVAYRLLPKNPSDEYYFERTDRNIGWITREEQKIIRKSVVGIAGLGGIGGLMAERSLRMGAGEIRIADIEDFDISNINRQFAAQRITVDKNKAFETARLLRKISDDTTIVIYPQGICEEVVEQFVDGCDVIADNIEFWAVAARILLHQRSRYFGVSMFNTPTIGFSIRVFFYTPTSMTVEEALNLTYEEAVDLQRKIELKTATAEEIKRVMNAVLVAFSPEFPDYYNGCKDFVFKRLFEEGKAPIISTNPPAATGIYIGRILFYLIRNSGVKRNITETPEMPGYLYFDTATLESKVVKGKWWK